jgi:tetratricopeptide (TPR) repeat protein
MPKSRPNRKRKNRNPSRAGSHDLGRMVHLAGGKSAHLQVFDFELHSEPVARLRPEVEALATQGFMLLQKNQGKEAEALFRKAIELDPEAPSLHNNLIAAIQLQGRMAEAETMTAAVFERFPNYLFARANRAGELALEGKVEEARAMVRPLLNRKRFHFSEFEAWAMAEMEIALAEGARDAAKQWFDMLEQVLPDSRVLIQYRFKIAPPKLKDVWKLFRR